uniref:Uncharacterized protein n=1 Tax=Anguilla anguilla TaxID=7936 RepID=A0A0E9SXS2_ANGAN
MRSARYCRKQEVTKFCAIRKVLSFLF